MKHLIITLKNEVSRIDMLAAFSCLVLSITIYVILNATNHL